MLEQLNTYLPTARSIRHLADLLCIPRSTLRDFLVREGLPSESIDALKAQVNTPRVTTTDQRIKDLVKIAELKRNTSTTSPALQQYEFVLERPTEPTIFCSWSDQHIGAAAVNHEAILAEVENLRQLRAKDSNFILVLNGDLIDGYIKGVSHDNNEQVLDIEEQRQFGKYVIETLRPELTISADHEAWSINSALQVNFTENVCRAAQLNYAQWQAKLVIKLDNGITKTVLVNHRYPGKTKLNPVRHLQALHNERGPADIVTTGHYHSNPGAYKLTPLRQNEDQFWGLQTGTNKATDAYSMKLNDYQGSYGIPAVVILPNGNIFGFDHYSEAVEYKKIVMAN